MLLAGQSGDPYAVPSMARLPRPLYVRAFGIPGNVSVDAHSHPWAQLMYATSGVLEVSTPSGRHLLPPHYAMWIPPHVPHAVTTRDCVAFHSLYLDEAIARSDANDDCTILCMTPLLRELVIATAELPVNYDETGPDGALVCVIADRIARMRPAPLTVPLPRDSRLLKIARALHAQPGDTRSLDEWGYQVGATRRTLSRLFRQDTGLSFTEWRQAVRLLASLPLLDAGEPIGAVAAQLGYDSTSSFIALFQAKFRVTPGAYAKREARRPVLTA
ncbi:AraC family transcriptional regulator [Burkholderia sp. JP2-270]|uniref:AraC family transcriptional regulator n=1 Tax=Burkholderia sp. JP2-270 TaxID=2217913 RepID=UPI000DA289A7|nr:helix-turn-helix transcriptional regulator [Burkholderia sp. JP2-270]AWV03134.1 AraC family transcriptional regulator [Burkholderia sp. JP2-270]